MQFQPMWRRRPECLRPDVPCVMHSWVRPPRRECHDDNPTWDEVRSIELVVQPGAKDAVGEMAVREGLPASDGGYRWADDGVCIVEVAKIHVKTLYFPGPVTCTPEIYHPLRTVAHHPTGINLGMTDGVANREWSARTAARYATSDCARSVQIYPAVG